VLLHVVCCAVTSGEKVDVSCNVFFVGSHEDPSWFTTQYPTKKTLQLTSTFSPLVTAQHTTCSNTRLGVLKMGIMMPETC